MSIPTWLAYTVLVLVSAVLLLVVAGWFSWLAGLIETTVRRYRHIFDRYGAKPLTRRGAHRR